MHLGVEARIVESVADFPGFDGALVSCSRHAPTDPVEHLGRLPRGPVAVKLAGVDVLEGGETGFHDAQHLRHVPARQECV